MARMIPAVLPRGLASPAEPVVFDALRDDEATEGWTVLHSLDIARHTTRPFGEADLVVIVPGWGVVVIEVKGVRSISRAPDGGWLLGSHAKPDPRGPFRQARDAMFSIRDELTARAPGVNLMTTSMVVLPFIQLQLESMEWHQWELADRPTIERYGYAGVVQRAMNGQMERLGRRPDARTMTASMVDDVIRVLRPSFEVNISPRERLADLEASTRRYTQEQFVALDAMGANRRVVFDGPAGTGKTVLAVESVRRASGSGERALLLCFNRLLAEHLRIEVASLPDVEVSTVHAHMLRTAGLSAPEADDELFWRTTLPEKATVAALERGPDVRFLVMDEAQDMLPDDALRTYLDAIVVGELSGGRWQAFGDFTNQAIFSRADGMPVDLAEVPHYSLVHNCRNARPIALAASAVGRLALGYGRVLREEEDPAVWIETYHDDDELLSRTVGAVGSLMAAGHPANEVAILLPRVDSVLGRTLDIGGRGGRGQDGVRTPVHSVQAFKGLESAAVVLAGIEDLSTEYWRSILYVGITRARHSVHIIVHADVRTELDRIVREGSA